MTDLTHKFAAGAIGLCFTLGGGAVTCAWRSNETLATAQADIASLEVRAKRLEEQVDRLTMEHIRGAR